MDKIKVDTFSFRYPDMKEYALRDISFNAKSGDFIVICGPSGCGKTTLLRLLKKELAPVGERAGELYFNQEPLASYNERILMEEIGFVGQDPDNQIIMDDVMQEIVFGLENLGYSHFEMRKRVAEMVHFFGMEDLLQAKPSELSGGQKQMVNLLSALLLKPSVLLLDEPTSQLDPVAAKDLIIMLERLNEEMGMTIILVEHRLEELFSVADQIYFMDQGEIFTEGAGRDVIDSLYKNQNYNFIPYIPSLSRLYMERAHCPSKQDIPLTVKESKAWLATRSAKTFNKENPPIVNRIVGSVYLELDHVSFQYDKKTPLILNNLSLKIKQGDFLAVIGGNGSGKTTLLKACLGLVKPQRGKVKFQGKDMQKFKKQNNYKKVAYLPQNPQTYFIHDTIEGEMKAEIKHHDLADGENKMTDMLTQFGITHLRYRHPFDCSGGEMQKAALACMLLSEPEILFIDEPTKGLDPFSKNQLGKLLSELHQQGLTIVMVTHDIEFAAKHALQCAIVFDGEITIIGSPESVLKGNYFYTTAINRATRGSHLPESLTFEEALESWKDPLNT